MCANIVEAFDVTIPSHLKDARLNMTRAAEVVAMNVGHLQRLVRRGVFPKPKRTSKGMPFFDYGLLMQISTILRTGVGLNAEEVSFYRRKQKTPKKRKTKARKSSSQSTDSFLKSVIEGCRELGVSKGKLDVEAVKQIMTAEFNSEQPELKDVIPVVARRLLRDNGKS